MTTLQVVTDASRKVLAALAMLLVGCLVLYFGVKIAVSIKEALYPTPPPPPTVTYGKLPGIAFSSQTSLPEFQYTINTVSGELPNLGDRTRVYKISQPQPNLLALNNATKTVAAVGFTSTPISVSDTDYSWTNSETPVKTLTMNIQTNNFSIVSNYMNDSTILAASNIPDQTHAVGTITDFLTNLNALPDDLDTSKTKISLFAISNNTLTPASSISTAQVVRVDFFQQNVNGLQVYYPNSSSSPMNFLLGSSLADKPQIVEAHFFHQNISSDFATYPIKTAQQAVQDLKNGNVYVASYPPSTTNITIRNISLGYFMSDTTQPYLMPIIVFQGDNNFFAYDSAVKDDWIGK